MSLLGVCNLESWLGQSLDRTSVAIYGDVCTFVLLPGCATDCVVLCHVFACCCWVVPCEVISLAPPTPPLIGPNQQIDTQLGPPTRTSHSRLGKLMFGRYACLDSGWTSGRLADITHRASQCVVGVLVPCGDVVRELYC